MNKRNFQQQSEEAAEIINKVTQGSSNTQVTQKKGGASSKDYYIRLKQMQQRLDKARQEIADNSGTSMMSPDLSKVNFADNSKFANELSAIQECKKGKVAANHTCAQTRDKYKVAGSTASKKSLHTTLRFKQSGTGARKQSRSLSVSATTSSNGAIKTAMAGGSSKMHAI